ncbi:MAG: type II toxin-antitoxin system PemK/MazF family toxin [Patescibacteria group bacterium]
MNEEYIKDFDKWNNVKKETDAKILPVEFFFLEREIWWASFGVNIGREIDGKNDYFERPILILKKFSDDTLWALPITSDNEKHKYSHKILYRDVKGMILLSQLRFISANRLLQLIRRIDEKEFDIIQNMVINLLKIKDSL